MLKAGRMNERMEEIGKAREDVVAVKEEVERDLQVPGVRRWRDLVADRKKNGRTLFDRPNPTVGCSANERRIYITDGTHFLT